MTVAACMLDDRRTGEGRVPAVKAAAAVLLLTLISPLLGSALASEVAVETDLSGFRLTRLALDTWYVHWLDANYVGSTKIAPTCTLTPSVSAEWENFQATVSFQLGAISGPVFAGGSRIDAGASLVSQKLSSKLTQSREPWFDIELSAGSFRGHGYYTYIDNTPPHELRMDPLLVHSTSVAGIVLLRAWPMETLGGTFLGVEYQHYRVPTLVRSEDYPDPRAPSDSIADVYMPQSRIDHFDVVVDCLRSALAPKALAATDGHRHAQINVSGHFRVLVLGAGVANNAIMGTVRTWSINSLLGNPKEVGTLSFVNGFDVDLAVRVAVPCRTATLAFTAGCRWLSWQATSEIKRIGGLRHQMFSTEAYLGPHLAIEFVL